MKRALLKISFLLVVLLFANSCGTTSKTNITGMLTSHTWELSTLNGKALDLTNFQTGTPFFRFEDGGKFSGSTGCNNFSGDFKLEKESLTLNPGAMTRMACPGNGETVFLEAMSQVKNLKTKGDKLILSDASRELMTLVPKK